MIALGNTEITKAYLGSTEISKMYLGEELVFGGDTPIPILPYDAQVEYLQSSGTQYIDTRVVLTKNYNVEADVAFISGTSFSTAIGSIESTYKFSVVLGINNNGYPYTQIGGGGSYAYYTQKTNYFDSIIRHYTLYSSGNRQYISCNGSSVSAAISGTISGLSLYLFARHKDKNSVGNYLIGKIGSIAITIDNVLMRDFIAVRKDGIGYLYDRVSGELFGNSGTGSFTYGNDIIT